MGYLIFVSFPAPMFQEDTTYTDPTNTNDLHMIMDTTRVEPWFDPPWLLPRLLEINMLTLIPQEDSHYPHFIDATVTPAFHPSK